MNLNAPVKTPLGHDVTGEIEEEVTVLVTIKYFAEWDKDRLFDPVIKRVEADLSFTQEAPDVGRIDLVLPPDEQERIRSLCQDDANKRIERERRDGV